ncbi:hypothetical protein ACIGFJ_12730 [Brevundimonas diminuta]|uniref:hypothetical protein n=1 Tax=Brevundimonas diminuta TaxID=293 RepID=UPI0037C64FDC
MTHPLTPREKVARAIQAHDNDHVPDGYANGLSDEVSDWSAYLADRVLTALASGSDDHAELARLAETNKAYGFLVSVQPETILAILAEIAALRAECDGMVEEVSRSQARLHAATEAERKLAEARSMLLRWRRHAPTEALEDLTDAWLSKEAERG